MRLQDEPRLNLKSVLMNVRPRKRYEPQPATLPEGSQLVRQRGGWLCCVLAPHSRGYRAARTFARNLPELRFKAKLLARGRNYMGSYDD